MVIELSLSLMIAAITFPFLWKLALRVHADVDARLMESIDRDRSLREAMDKALEAAREEAQKIHDMAVADSTKLLAGTRALVNAEIARQERALLEQRERRVSETREKVLKIVDGGIGELEVKSEAARERLRRQLVGEVLKVIGPVLQSRFGDKATEELLARLRSELLPRVGARDA